MSQILTAGEGSFTLNLPQPFPVTLLLIGGIALSQHYSTLAYLAARKRIFGQLKYMDNFKEDHRIAFDNPHKIIHPHGDPDSVDGWYSKLLSYREWYILASAKRAHQE
jgi:hypothetical protein